MQTTETYDYVVVGGGSSGCVVAARLAEEGAGRVLLLEAGNAADKNPETMSADGFIQSFANDNVMLDRLSEPQANCGKRRIYAGSGTGMGGSGAVNGMVYTRGDKLDFAQWPKGWRWDDVVPAFEKLEQRLRARTRKPTPFLDTCADAAVQAGFKRKDELNDGDLCGYIGYQLMNFEGDRRRSSYVSFIHGVKNERLEIKTDARMHRVVVDANKRAVAVEFEQVGKRYSIAVNREVILCAGALESPKLLMLSGIGESAQLAQLGIPVVLDAPSVGKHMQDHPSLGVFFRGKHEPDSFYPQLYGFDRVNNTLPLPSNQADTCYVMFTTPTAIGQSMKRMLPAMTLPASLFRNVFLRRCLNGLADFMFWLPPTRRFVAKMYGVVVILGKPFSRGEVRLASANPREQAQVNPGYFTDPRDLETMVDGVLKAQAIAKQPQLKEWGNKAVSPIASTVNRDKIRKGVRGGVMTTFHYCSTCKMGEDDASPVDTQLRVKGIQNLRVADASVIPEIPVSALNAPSMMIGYRAADFILDELRAANRL